MKYYALFDESGRLKSRYEESTNPKIPDEALEISEDDFFNSIYHPEANWYYVDGKLESREHNESVVVSKTDIERLRLIAYSDPIYGSDRYFIEGLSLQAEGFTKSSPEFKETLNKALERKEQIKKDYPYPNEESDN